MEQVRPVNVGDADFENEVLQPKVPVLVDFWAPWCRPCRTAAGVLEKIAQEYHGRLKVCKLNIEEAREAVNKYGVMSVPTLYLYKNGKVVGQIAGVTPDYESDIKKKIEPYLSSS